MKMKLTPEIARRVRAKIVETKPQTGTELRQVVVNVFPIADSEAVFSASLAEVLASITVGDVIELMINAEPK